MENWQNRQILRWDEFRERWGLRDLLSPLMVALCLLLLVWLALGWYWSREPRQFPVTAVGPVEAPPGLVLVTVEERLARTLVDKPGGFIDNDVMPPGSMMDDMPAWERGVLGEVRDFVAALALPGRLDALASPADPDVADAVSAFNVDPGAWSLPSAESEFRRGADALHRHAERMEEPGGRALAMREVQLDHWLVAVQARLDGLTARLNAAQATSLRGVTVAPGTEAVPTTPWNQVDDVFFEARGASWALLHQLKAAEIDFDALLAARHADLDLRAAIHELEATQQPVWSPVILNGAGFGVFANHSLVMANYLGRASARLGEVESQLLDVPVP
ncbi:MAG TPA: DUF2333 family protein [Moraxellaceae bacterium]|nr:DUF2333 family protein [Moraxellaceae bacterium]